MRTTLTLEDDLVSILEAEMNRSGRTLDQTVNEYLRLGLNAQSMRKPFVVKPFNFGTPEGANYDNVAELLDLLEGPDRR